MSSVIGGNYVKRSGDTMTGNLEIQGSLSMNDNISMAAGKTVDGVDVSAINYVKMINGSYVGNDTDDRNINIGVNLSAKTNVWLLIKSATAQYALHRNKTLTGDASQYFTNDANVANYIQQFTSTGFQIGDGIYINSNGVTYYYTVFYED